MPVSQRLEEFQHLFAAIITRALKDAELSNGTFSKGCKDFPDNFRIERELYNEVESHSKYSSKKSQPIYIAGTDEAGRGPLAGPVVAAAVILPRNYTNDNKNAAFTDSKKLTSNQRDTLYCTLEQIGAILGIGIATVKEIDTINILQASLLAMKRAVLQLSPLPSFLLVDGKFTVPFSCPENFEERDEKTIPAFTAPIIQQALIKGESKSASIAAASIIAKVTRDQIMKEIDRQYPNYGFARHKGYPTKAHKEAIGRFGICPEHRRTFRGVKEFVSSV